MRPKRTPLLITLVFLVSPSLVAAQAPKTPISEATVPLGEILRLYQEVEESRRKRVIEPPPVEATVHQIQMSGRLLDGAVDLTARFEIVVLADDQWISVPLLKQDTATQMSALPAVENGFFTVDGGYLRLLTRHRGSYVFDISFLKRAERSERKRVVRIEYGRATVAVCRIQFDKGLFRMRGNETIERSDGAVLFPDQNVFNVEWERMTEAAVVKKAAVAAPAIDSVIPVAHASVISTLEGKRFVRARYELRFAGTKRIDFEVPSALSVERAYLNGVSIPLKIVNGTLPIEVAPTREGDQSGVLELVLSSSGGSYFLSGTLDVRLPRASWPINELFLDLHLPQVFNYEWAGGSLSPVENAPTAKYTYDLPLPGKRQSFHQHLITSSSPHVTLDYAVDLEGHYYRP